MRRERLTAGLTIAYAGMSVVLGVAGVLTNPIALVVAAVFAAVAGLLWYQASGRLAGRVYRRVERQAAVDGGRGGFGAGPREPWTSPSRRQGRRTHRTGASRDRPSDQTDTLSPREAYRILDLDPEADAASVRAAYRERIKQVHPDTAGGDEAAFRRVRAAYERLSD